MTEVANENDRGRRLALLTLESSPCDVTKKLYFAEF